MPDIVRRDELKRFLQTRRARLQPLQIGLSLGGRRRVQGLRREEVALAAGVSVTWYTWLEQGRPIHASPAMLDSLARALQLSTDEARYLHLLAGEAPALAEDPPISTVLQQVLDGLTFSPAFVMGATWDILAWNTAARYVFGDFEAMVPEQRNVLWLVIMGDSLCRFVRDPEAHRARVIAEFRSSVAPYLGEPRVQRLLGALEAHCPDFREHWEAHEVRERSSGQKILAHPEAGPLVFDYTTLQVLDAPMLRLVVYTGDSATQDVLRAMLTLQPAPAL
jgi:transcriptional regulator with XRE-family HTH domain